MDFLLLASTRKLTPARNRERIATSSQSVTRATFQPLEQRKSRNAAICVLLPAPSMPEKAISCPACVEFINSR